MGNVKWIFHLRQYLMSTFYLIFIKTLKEIDGFEYLKHSTLNSVI